VIRCLIPSAVLALAGTLARVPIAVVLILAVVVVIAIVATYILIAKRGIAPELDWGSLSIKFARVPDQEDTESSSQNS